MRSDVIPPCAHAGEGDYVVFSPKPSSIEEVKGKWGWDEAEEAAAPQVPQWNPRTGFMGERGASSSSSEDREASGAASTSSTSEPIPDVHASMLTAPVDAGTPLPSVPKDQAR